MPVLKRQTLQTKFLVGLLLAALALGLFFSVSLNIHLRGLMETDVSEKARVILAHAEAIQGYVRRTLRPALYKVLPEGQFLIEGMSTSFVTRQVMNDLNMTADQYSYRRAAIDARNPDFEADGLERELVAYFKAHPQDKQFREFREEGGLEYYLAARPVRFEASCLHCHGQPSEAPSEMIERYGAERGFGRQVEDIAGVDLVKLPVEGAVIQIREATLKFGVVFAGGMLFFFALLTVFFNRLVVHNLRRLTDILRRHFSDEADSQLMDRLNQGDEIDELVAGMESFASHLRQARLQLQDYAANLAGMVEERTQDLKREASERTVDVQLFVDLLNGLNQSQTGRELLSAALERIAKRFGASRVSYACALSAERFFSWPDETFAPELPDDWRALLASGEARFAPGRALVPVQTPDLARGLLCVFWDDDRDSPSQARDVLRAVGQQLGVALENLDALDNLLRQKDMLASVFEGISDPLFLVDGARRTILANRSARELTARPVGEGHVLKLLLGPGEGLGHGRDGGTADDGGADKRPADASASGLPAREVRLPDGRSFSIHLYPLHSPQVRPSLRPPDREDDARDRLIVYARENTAEKRMLAQVQQSEKVAAVGNLAAGLAHEINNPLGVILCYAQLLRKTLGEDGQLADLDVIVRHAKQAQKILQDLLDFARPKKAGAGPCDAAAIARALARVFKAQAKTARVALESDIGDGLPLVRCDPAAVEQILANLLINAFDAAPPETGRIRVRVAARPGPGEMGAVEIVVSDNGPGIAPEHLGRIFDPFFTTKDVGKGTGLGLTVVYGLVREMDGRIEVDNAPGGGAVFTLSLPAVAAGAGLGPEAASSLARGAASASGMSDPESGPKPGSDDAPLENTA